MATTPVTTYNNFIDGKWVASSTGRTYPITNPAQKSTVLGEFQVSGVDDALSAGVREPRQSPEPFDGIAELWWDSVEEFAPSESSPERRQAGAELLEDERKFIDLPRSPVWMARERPVVEG